MLSVQSQQHVLPSRDCPGTGSSQSQRQLQPVCVEDGVQAFKDLSVRTGRAFLRLHCTVPTWSSAPVNCVDLHDLHDLQSRSLVFLHELQKSLRAVGVQVTYQLAPADTDVVVIQPLAEGNARRSLPRYVDAGVNGSGKMLMGRTERGPLVVMT